MKRRDMLGNAGLGTAAAVFGLLTRKSSANAETDPPATKSLGPLKITKVRAILTAPSRGNRYVVVKVETSEPGLYGLGCASFRQRPCTSTSPRTTSASRRRSSSVRPCRTSSRAAR